MSRAFKPYKEPKLTGNAGTDALKRINSTPGNFGQAEGIAKPQSYPEQGAERLENKFKALKSALARSTSGKPTK